MKVASTNLSKICNFQPFSIIFGVLKSWGSPLSFQRVFGVPAPSLTIPPLYRRKKSRKCTEPIPPSTNEYVDNSHRNIENLQDQIFQKFYLTMKFICTNFLVDRPRISISATIQTWNSVFLWNSRRSETGTRTRPYRIDVHRFPRLPATIHVCMPLCESDTSQRTAVSILSRHGC